VGVLRSRFPEKPVALADVAAVPATPEALRAVVRTPEPGAGH
jgi:predicted secreted protein